MVEPRSITTAGPGCSCGRSASRWIMARTGAARRSPGPPGAAGRPGRSAAWSTTCRCAGQRQRLRVGVDAQQAAHLPRSASASEPPIRPRPTMRRAVQRAWQKSQGHRSCASSLRAGCARQPRAMARTWRTSSAKRSGLSDCPPSDRASSGLGCTSMISPSAPAAMPARAIGVTYSQLPGAVAGVEDHRQVGERFEHRDGVDIGGVAGGGLEGADAALAQDHPPVAVREDVFGRHQQLFDRGGDAAFEQHRVLAFAGGVQQGKVLHVARADLQHIGILGHQRAPARGPSPRSRSAGRSARALRPASPALLRPGPGRNRARCAVCTRRRAALCAGFFDRLGGLQQLAAALHRAGSGDDDHLIAADLNAIQREDRVLRDELARGHLVRPRDRHDPVDAGHINELLAGLDAGCCPPRR